MDKVKKFKVKRTDKKYRVDFWEFERGWGSRIDFSEDFDTIEKAKKRIKDFNSSNKEDKVPDWYMVAQPNNFEI